jgi:hypothetical protein|tara:strand:+ start:908 stop:1789 length:882 start_codon:yes stop_codon:yes gene_type:complete
MPEFNPAEFNSNIEQNPLRKYFRQPKVYITLPSKGKFYQPNSINIPEGEEYPVYAMTAKDELTMKTPDALLNGAATVEIVKSCVPAIINPWAMPSIDLDAILIAIRIATYGDTMEIETKAPVTGDDKTFSVDLRTLLNKLVTKEYNTELQLGEMKINTRPLTYREFTDASLKTFEEQRIFALVDDEKISDTEKLSRFNDSFQKLTNLTINTIASSITSIEFGDEVVENTMHIQEFMQNSDKQFYSDVLKHVETQRDLFALEPLKVSSTDEDVAKGAPKEWEVPITFDQSNFFG